MSFGELTGEGDVGKREELIGNVADHYTYHACVMTLITPLNRPLPPLTPLTNTRLNDKLEDTRVIVPKHPPLQNDPLCSLLPFSFPSPFSVPPPLISLQTNAWTCWILDNNPPLPAPHGYWSQIPSLLSPGWHREPFVVLSCNHIPQ